MLYIVLVVVLAALGLLVTALVTANSLWAWLSIGLSVLAGLVMLTDVLRRRRSARATDPGADVAESDADADADESDADPAADEPSEVEPAAGDTVVTGTAAPSADTAEGEPDQKAGETQFMPAVGGSLTDTDADAPGEDVVMNGDPEEEQTDAADLLIVSELDAEVLVVDEFPRYHLDSCGWLLDRETIPIEVAEARELGFTPCARCAPDAELAAAHRATRKAKRA